VHLLSQPRRPRRLGEWTPDKAVTFIVSLAARRSVTLAARAAGMSRKSAYALKARDPAFAAAWTAAAKAGAKGSVQGNKVDKVDGPPTPPARGDSRAWRASLTSDSRSERARAFTDYVAWLRDLPPLAPCPPAQ
jgi:hypothetical protein